MNNSPKLHNFKDSKLFQTATTHHSYINEHPNEKRQNYQRLEFLGDTVLKLIQSEYLYYEYPNYDEGKLTKIRNNLENNTILSEWCSYLKLDKYISVGNSIVKKGKTWVNIRAQVFEAYLGSIWLDCDNDFEYIYTLFSDWSLPVKEMINYKGILQEYCQGLGISPEYIVYKKKGQDHNPEYLSQCIVKDEKVWAIGKTIKESQKNCAKKICILFKLTGK